MVEWYRYSFATEQIQHFGTLYYYYLVLNGCPGIVRHEWLLPTTRGRRLGTTILPFLGLVGRFELGGGHHFPLGRILWTFNDFTKFCTCLSFRLALVPSYQVESVETGTIANHRLVGGNWNWDCHEEQHSAMECVCGIFLESLVSILTFIQ